MHRYTLDRAVALFFESVSPTRQDCEYVAGTLLNSTASVVPVPIQGQFSFTVTSPTAITPAERGVKLVQFRQRRSLLDVQLLQKAKSIHGRIVPETAHVADMCCSPTGALAVYLAEKMPGVTYFEFWRDSIDFDDVLTHVNKQTRFVKDMARYFGESCCHSEGVTKQQKDRWRVDTVHQLSRLATVLPPKSARLAADLCDSKVDDMLAAEYPFVLAHGDLNATNILVDPNTGHLTGLVDWAEAEVQPFGLALDAVDSLLDYPTASPSLVQSPDGSKTDIWQIDAEAESCAQLHKIFWQEMWQYMASSHIGQALEQEQLRGAVNTARQVGILLRHAHLWLDENGTSTLTHGYHCNCRGVKSEGARMIGCRCKRLSAILARLYESI